MKYKKVVIGQVYYAKRFAQLAIVKCKRKGSVHVEMQNGTGRKIDAGELSHYDDVKDII